MNKLIFATGNKSKFYEASTICRDFQITLEQHAIAIDEIQHHDSLKITEAKVKSAYDAIRQPLVVNDSTWRIPALGGFPGGYMKDVASWLSTEDFQALMKDKSDKRIFLNEIVAYYDGVDMTIFTHERLGHFREEPSGNSLPSFAKLVQMESDEMTISEIFDAGNWDTKSVDEYKHWYDFARWHQRSVSENEREAV